jgi:shikimate kinase/3-dehydroquinate synthase
VREMLLERGLPVLFEGAGVDEVLRATVNDKKRIGSQVPFVLVTQPGEVRIGCEVPADEVRAAVAELAA